MQFYIYCEPAGEHTGEPVWTIMSKKAITEGAYWDRWSSKVREKGLFLEESPNFMREWCLDDFCMVNWAVEVTPEELQKIICQAPKH